MFWTYNTYDRKTAETAANADKRAEKAIDETRELKDALDRLVLINRAMWELLSEQHGITDVELGDKMNEIDLRDGTLDGRTTNTMRECSSCRRQSATRRGRCLYCGDPMVEDGKTQPDPFDTMR